MLDLANCDWLLEKFTFSAFSAVFSSTGDSDSSQVVCSTSKITSSVPHADVCCTFIEGTLVDSSCRNTKSISQYRFRNELMHITRQTKRKKHYWRGRGLSWCFGVIYTFIGWRRKTIAKVGAGVMIGETSSAGRFWDFLFLYCLWIIY